MTEDAITITSGAPPTDLEPGVYEVTLIEIGKPRIIYPQSGPNSGKEVELRDWTFALDGGDIVTSSASTRSGPKSKAYSWITALIGGTPPPAGTTFPFSQLIGRGAIATIAIDEGGYLKITNLSAIPKARAPRAPAPEPAAAAPVAPTPVAATVHDDDIPF
jgi:hypothetical protein